MRTAMKNWLVPLGSTALVILACEVGLRIAGIEYKTFVVPDEELGWALRPSSMGWYRYEGAARIQINSAGFRGPEIRREKPAGVFRVAVIGDSFTIGLDVPDEQIFTHLLEKRLNGNPCVRGQRVEVLNFGVGGYGTLQELMVLRKHALAYRPDLVLLMFFSGNDVSDNSRAIRQSMTDEAPFLVPDGRGGWLVDNSFHDRRGWWLKLGPPIVYHSRMLQVANQARKVISMRRSQHVPQPVVHREESKDDPLIEEAWKVTAVLTQIFRDECRRAGVDLLVGIIPKPESAGPDAAVLRGDESAVVIDRRFERICRDLGIDSLPLFPALAKYASENNRHVCGFPSTMLGQGHWNRNGHLVAGETLAAAICARFGR
jgi:lysophospholipase L1-like esterase